MQTFPNGANTPEVTTGLEPQPGSNVVVEPVTYSPLPIPEGTPVSGVNNSVYPGSKAVSTSSNIPMVNGGGNYDFNGEEFNRQNNYVPYGGTPDHPEIPGLNDPIDPGANLKWLWEKNQKEAQARQQYLNEKARQEANTGSWWGNVWDGTKRGFQYSVDAGKHEGRTASAVWNRAPKTQYENLQPEGQAGFLGGRVAGEIGNGTRQVFWNLTTQVETLTSTLTATVERLTALLQQKNEQSADSQ